MTPHSSTPLPDDQVEIDASELSGIWAVPDWLRGAGQTSWLLVGLGVLLVGIIWLLSLTNVIVLPVIAAGIVAAVASPLVAWMHGHGVPRGLGAALMLLAIVAVGVGLSLAVVGGIVGQSSAAESHLSSAQDKITGYLEDAGVDPGTAEDARSDVSSGTTASAKTLLNGVVGGLSTLSSLAFFLAMTTLSLFFLLKDGPTIRAWTDRHLGLPGPVARDITGRVLGSLRGYFLGTTIVAAFNAVVVALGAWILGVPLIGTIVAVTFVGAYIPYIGAWSAAIFSILVALGGAGPDAAAGMIVLQLLANGVLQQLVQPFAMGTALGLHPLAVLIVTIGGGALFGTVGLILAAPMVSAVVRISADLAKARANAEPAVDGPKAPQAAPA
jgi:predicted PurR-regulated permease PerM